MSGISGNVLQIFRNQFGLSVSGGVVEEYVENAQQRIAHQGDLSRWLGEALLQYALIDPSEYFDLRSVPERSPTLLPLVNVLAIAQGWKLRVQVKDPSEVLRRARQLSGDAAHLESILASLSALLDEAPPEVPTPSEIVPHAPAPHSEPPRPRVKKAAQKKKVLRVRAKPRKKRKYDSRLVAWDIRGPEGVAEHAKLFEVDWGKQDHFVHRSGRRGLSIYGFAALDPEFHGHGGRLLMGKPRPGDAFALTMDPRTGHAVVGRLPRVMRDDFESISEHLLERLQNRHFRRRPNYMWTNSMSHSKRHLRDMIAQRLISPYGVELMKIGKYFADLGIPLSDLETGVLFMSGCPGKAGFGSMPADAHAILGAAHAAGIKIHSLEVFAADTFSRREWPEMVYDGSQRVLTVSDIIALRVRRAYDLAPHAVRLMDEATRTIAAKGPSSAFQAAFQDYFLALAGAAFAAESESFRIVMRRAERCPFGDDKASLRSLAGKYQRLHEETFGAIAHASPASCAQHGVSAAVASAAVFAQPIVKVG